MDTKLCRHCKQPIHLEARVCQHCHSPQSWFGNSRDPRSTIAWVVVAVVVVIPLMFFGTDFAINRTMSRNKPVAVPTLVVSDISTRVASTPDGAKIFVLGATRNTSSRDASRIWFRVTMRNGGGKLVDTLLLEDRGLLVPSGKTVPFRLSGLLSIKSLDGIRTEVVVERAKVASEWD